jgi:hypothetical protein
VLIPCSPTSLDVDPKPIRLLPMGLCKDAFYIPSLQRTFKYLTTGVIAAMKFDIQENILYEFYYHVYV